MKQFIKKYIGIILSYIMLGLAIWAHEITATNPGLAHTLMEIILWYFSFIITVVIILLLLKVLLRCVRWLKKRNPGLGICMEKNCQKSATRDYNGCGHYVCDDHFDLLSSYFDEEYK